MAENKTKIATLARLDIAVRKRLVAIAKRDGLSLSYVINKALKDWLK